MKSKIRLEFSEGLTPADAQAYLFEWLDSFMKKGIIKDYSFEIETENGVVTDRCILENNTVIA